jgi:hypothetical protein
MAPQHGQLERLAADPMNVGAQAVQWDYPGRFSVAVA